MDSTVVSIFPEQKGLKSAGKRHSEGLQPVGKDEVGSSNLPSNSTRKSLKSLRFQGFLRFRTIVFPLCFPLLAFELPDIRLHAVRAGTFHLLRDVTISFTTNEPQS